MRKSYEGVTLLHVRFSIWWVMKKQRKRDEESMKKE